MIAIEQALKNVQKEFPKFKVVSSYEFRGKYVFDMIEKEEIEEPQGYTVEVIKDGDGKVLTPDTDEMFSHLDELEEAKKNKITY